MAEYRVFQGKETKQIDEQTTRPAEAESWYYEPSDYKGDVLYSPPFATQDEADTAAAMELQEAE